MKRLRLCLEAAMAIYSARSRQFFMRGLIWFTNPSSKNSPGSSNDRDFSIATVILSEVRSSLRELLTESNDLCTCSLSFRTTLVVRNLHFVLKLQIPRG
ncbi:MAG TPA: hypothetical protein VFA85_04540 [Terriglobales bacterium]|nr:hypothetical protein [Terriglobales bacterium]